MKAWQIVAVIGLAISFFSAFLDLLSSLFVRFSLLDFYELEMGMKGTMKPGLPSSLSPLYLTMVCYPIAILLGVMLLTIIRRRPLALAAGSVGIIGWICAMLAVSNVRYAQFGGRTIAVAEYGIGILVGLVGAGALLASYFIPSDVSITRPTQHIPSTQERFCTACGAELREEDVYCHKCARALKPFVQARDEKPQNP